MSRAGKFIPGGTGRKTTSVSSGAAVRTGPIRAPVEPSPEDIKGSRKPFGKGGGLIKPVARNQRLPIALMSGAVCCLLFVAAYVFVYLPEVRRAATAESLAHDMQKQRDDAVAQAAQQKQQDDLRKAQQNSQGTLMLDTRPTGANVTIGTTHKITPATFDGLTQGAVSVLIQADGYQDYKQDVTIASDKPTDLGTIELVQKTGSIALSSPQEEVEYILTGPGGFDHEGQLPDKFENVPAGDFQLTVRLHDWKLPPVTITVHDKEAVQKEIKFPFASVTINSTPPGATVRDGRAILGRTPLALPHLHPGDLNLSIDLPPYTIQKFVLTVPDFATITKDVALEKDKDFVAACGMAMVWIPDGNFWAGKYDVRQMEFETVAKYNPSTFRRPNRPVETVSWETAKAFCDLLTQYERKAGKLPPGYHYALPTESQWSEFSADADIDQAAMSRGYSLTSTQDVGASEPNKYGLYDTLGNVWEWCQDLYDDSGNHSLRGGGWLSSAENFPSPDTRIGASPQYADRFSGFRVVLVPD